MKNGIKVMIFEGADILKDNLDNNFTYKEYQGMFTDSKLQDKLIELGLNVDIKKESTNDIVMLKFSYGYTSKAGWKLIREIKELKNGSKQLIEDKKCNLKIRKQQKSRAEKEPYSNKIENLSNDIKNIKNEVKNKQYQLQQIMMSKSKVREKLYTEGFHLNFYKKDRTTKEYKLDTTIRYKFWFRTPSKSRVGNVLFINEKLYDAINKYQTMDIELQKDKEGKVKLVEMEAYKSLIASHQEEKVQINPNNILVVNDLESYYKTMCAKVYYHVSDEENNVNDTEDMCFVRNVISKVKNTLFDGMALLDDTVFQESNYLSEHSMALLRQHYFKACGFRSFIQRFYQDYCREHGLDYSTYSAKDRYGNYIQVKNILMITTENSMKWEKLFNDKVKGFNSWKEHVIKDDCMFSICKTEHPSKYDMYQRMSYQMVNTLDINESQAVDLCEDTINYINLLKEDNNEFIKFLKRTANDMNNNDMMIDLLKRNNNIKKTALFRVYKTKTLSKYKETLRAGKLLAHGDNLTVCGNPYILLLHSVGALDKYIKDNVIEGYEDPTLPILEKGKGISIYTKKFNDNEQVAMFRNPHNSPNNIILGVNHNSEFMDKYFKFNENIVAVNCIKTDVQDRANSMDFDSDFVFSTNNITAKEAAIKAQNYPTIVNCIEKSNKKYNNSLKDLADIDNGLAKAKYAIGLSSNTAQVALSWYWKYKTQELADIVAILSVLAQCAIDNSKRMYQVDLNAEIGRIRKLNYMQLQVKIGDKKYIAKPYFWQFIKEIKEKDKKYKKDRDKNKELKNKIEAKAEAKKEKKAKEEDLIKHCLGEKLCPMDFIQDGIDLIKHSKDTGKYLKIEGLINVVDGKAKKEQMDKIKELIKELDNLYKEQHDEEEMEDEEWEIYRQIKTKETIDKIKSYSIKDKNMQMLVTNALYFRKENSKYRLRLLNCLYQAHKEEFLNVFKKGEFEKIEVV